MRGRWRMLVALLGIWVLGGCGGEDDEENFDEDLPELGTAVEARDENATEPNNARPDNSETRKTGTQAEAAGTALKPGTDIPLRKRVVETLSYDSEESRAELVIDLRLSIDEVVEGRRRRLGVHYERVRYSGRIDGERFQYDSADPPDNVPPQAVVYHGLPGNDFFVWFDEKGEMALVGFDRFLRRCVEHLPARQRQPILEHLLMATDQERVAKFIDPTFGLLPRSDETEKAGEALKAGHKWTTKREVGGPVAMKLMNEYTIRKVEQNKAEIEIRGTLGPTVGDVEPAAHQSGPEVRPRGGRTIGTCTIDRRTGIPLSADVERFLELEVVLPDGSRLQQQKHIVTTLEPREDQSEAQ